MRTSSKDIVYRVPGGSSSIPAHFNKPEVDATLRDKGYSCIFEKAYLCPCKGRNSVPLTVCKNCGGSGWVFCNPMDTNFIITGIQHDSKLKEAALNEMGLWELGVVNVTAIDEVKFSMMDKITIKDATAEHTQIIYPFQDGGEMFTYTKYDIKAIDYLGLFVDPQSPLIHLVEGTDYTFENNVIKFISGITDSNSNVTVRYVHHPIFHIIDILRESFTSYDGKGKLDPLPIKAVAKRAHLIQDVENVDGDRLLDNSWLPQACTPQVTSALELQVKYGDPIAIYNFMTDLQKSALQAHLGI